jgi:hypothetical protein
MIAASPVRILASSPMPRKARRIRAGAGWIMVLGAAGLLRYFLQHVNDSVPYYPMVWIGGPLLPVATFLLITGAMLVVRRQVSLAAMLCAVLAAGFAAGGAGWCMRADATRQERAIGEMKADERAEKNVVEPFLRLASRERLESLATAAWRDGLIDDIGFDCAQSEAIRKGERITLSLVFEQWRFHRRETPTSRHFIAAYCTLALKSCYDVDFESRQGLQSLMFDLCCDEDRNESPLAMPALVEETRRRLDWLLKRETDPGVARIMRMYLGTFDNKLKDEPVGLPPKEGKTPAPPPKPPIPSTKKPAPQTYSTNVNS